jgi:hypothetical protein
MSWKRRRSVISPLRCYRSVGRGTVNLQHKIRRDFDDTMAKLRACAKIRRHSRTLSPRRRPGPTSLRHGSIIIGSGHCNCLKNSEWQKHGSGPSPGRQWVICASWRLHLDFFTSSQESSFDGRSVRSFSPDIIDITGFHGPVDGPKPR